MCKDWDGKHCRQMNREDQGPASVCAGQTGQKSACVCVCVFGGEGDGGPRRCYFCVTRKATELLG